MPPAKKAAPKAAAKPEPKPAAKSKAPAAKKPGKAKEPLKDPEGGLTDPGREHFKQTEGADLKPGVKGAPKDPEEMKRKGSFLRRHYANPQGTFTDKDGKPTRFALQAKAWGEKVPKTAEDAAALAAKGERLMERYKKLRDKEKAEKQAAAKADRDKAKADKLAAK